MIAAQPPAEVRSADVVLREAFNAILKEAPKRLKDLRDACTADLECLGGADAVPAGGTFGDNYFKALKLGCEAAGSPKVVHVALDTIQKLIHQGQLTGRGADPFTDAALSEGRLLIDTIVESITSCAEQGDDTVQLKQVQALMTVVTAQTCEVHANSLLLCLSTVFKIHCNSKSQMNERQASTAMTQMLNTVVQRMELSSADMSRRGISLDDAAPGARQIAQQRAVNADLQTMPADRLLNEWNGAMLGKLIDEVVHNSGAEEAQARGKFGFCVVCRAPAAHYCVDTKDPVCSRACKQRNLERGNLVESHYGVGQNPQEPAVSSVVGEQGQVEASPRPAATNGGDAAAAAEPASAEEAARQAASRYSIVQFAAAMGEEADEAFTELLNDKAANQSHRDAVLAFNFLCNQSMKDSSAAAADARSNRTKRTALELINSMLQHSGPVIRSSMIFMHVLKKNLCMALIKNSVSLNPKIFQLSLNLFVLLTTNFKEHLRFEIGLFIEQIFLRILESGNSSFNHKSRVLQVFYKLCTDAATALELFLNFDCDVDEKNIFERMIDCLSKIAQGKYTSVEHSNLIQPHQEQELKGVALTALVTLMGSIVDWARRMTEDRAIEHDHPGVNGAQELSKVPEAADSDNEDDDQRSVNTMASGATAATTHVSNSIVEQKQRKLELQIGVNKFNMKAKRGIEYLKQNGFISDNPQDVAELFLKGDLGLDKTAIGDYLGEDKPFNKGILFALVDSRDFKGQELDASLRSFLSFFRLPGEAQKIDRMMEKFAEKYCQDNPDKFANADCAFVLSFSLIMLQTDLHNPGVKNKMTKAQFVSNNRGINNNQDLPREYLERLYDGIVNDPISLKEDLEAKNRLDSQAAQNAAQKQELFNKETESMICKTQELIKSRTKDLNKRVPNYVAAQSVEHVRPLFEVACWPYLATLAVLLEMSDEATTVESCIEGFKHCIRVAARFDMDTERDAFVSSLAKFTYLITIKEMKPKNIDCIKALLSIGLSEGNNLGPSWQYVLHCISQLQRLELIGSHSKQDFIFFAGEEDGASPSPGQAQAARNNSSTQAGQVIKRRATGLGVSALVSLGSDDRQVELYNSESVVSQIDSAQIELLFNRSTSLNAQAIVHFVTAVARVSKDELALVDQPRIFLLQKLVEIADYNMKRSRLEWQKMWRAMSKHFIEAASHPNSKVCIFAIDSVRQLASKFLEKEELSMFQFQADFLNPYEVLMTVPGVSIEAKGHIVNIIHWMAEQKHLKIKSGWKTILHIIRAAAQEGNEEIAKTAFASLEAILNRSYEVLIENFTDGVQALLAFGQCKVNLDMSKKAVQHLLQASEYLADKTRPDPPPLPPNSTLAQVPGVPQDASRHPAEHWLHILRGLSALVSDLRREVRSEALTGLFDCLQKHGSSSFDEDTWRMVFNGVIKPLFDDIHHQLQPAEQRKQEGGMADTSRSEAAAASWSQHMGPPTCLQALTALVRLFDAHLKPLSFLLEDVLALIKNCINHDTEAVARIGVEGFKQLLLLTGANMGPECWEKVTTSIKRLFAGSMPTKLMCVEATASGEGQLPFRKDDVVIQCVVQLLLIDMLQDTVAQHYEHIPPSGVMTLLDALQSSFEFAQEFNQQIELRQTLKRMGFIREMRQLPGLLKQEREALSCSLKVLFQVQGDPRMQNSEFAAQADEKLKRLCSMVLRNYAHKERLLQEQADAPTGEATADSASGHDREAATVEMEREVMGLVPIISDVVLRGLRDFPPDQFSRYAPELFPLLCELTVVNSREVRERVREVLLDRVAPLLVVR